MYLDKLDLYHNVKLVISRYRGQVVQISVAYSHFYVCN